MLTKQDIAEARALISTVGERLRTGETPYIQTTVALCAHLGQALDEVERWYQPPPYDTDNGLAIRAAVDWCQKHAGEIRLEYSTKDNCGWEVFLWWGEKKISLKTMVKSQNTSLATAICEALVAAEGGG